MYNVSELSDDHPDEDRIYMNHINYVRSLCRRIYEMKLIVVGCKHTQVPFDYRFMLIIYVHLQYVRIVSVS